MNSGFITLPNNETIWYEETGAQFLGKSPSVLFVHGNFSTCEWWHDTIANLKNLKRHLIAVDQRGFGKSSYKKPCLCFGDWAQDLKAFCKARGIEKCIANGWSFGGGVSMKFAQIAPEIVQKIVLTCSVSNEGLRMKKDGIECLTRDEITSNHKADFMIKILETKNEVKMNEVYNLLIFSHIKDYPKEKKDKILQGSFQQRCYVDLLVTLANSDIDASKIKAEALMIHGKKDLVVAWDSVQHMQKIFKNVVVWQENAHMIPLENPQKYEELFVKFIEEK